MMGIVNSIFCSFITAVGIILTSAKLSNKKLDTKDYKLLIILIFETLYLSISYHITDSFIRVMINYFILTIINKYLFQKDMCESNVIAFFTILLFLIAENIYVFLMVIILKLDTEQLSNWFVNIFNNLSIVSFALLFIYNKKISGFLRKQISRIVLSTNKSLILLLGMTLISLLVLMYSIYYQSAASIILLLNTIIILFYLVIIITIFKEKTEKKQLQSEYDATLKNLNDYEQMLDLQRMKNHENDNHLSVIRGMIDPKNKEAIEFIDSLTEKAKNDNTDIVFKTKNIPSGGLQGLIYQKVLFMEQKKYHYNLEVSKEIKKLKLKKMKTEDVKDMCTVVGVLLDNAIQAVQGYRKKLVGIYLYKEKDNLVITISNNFKGNLELEKFEERGYTTKSTGHGYGLSLAKEIIDRNPNITNEKSFHGEVFSQVLKVKIT